LNDNFKKFSVKTEREMMYIENILPAVTKELVFISYRYWNFLQWIL